jgi:hypothetical protein
MVAQPLKTGQGTARGIAYLIPDSTLVEADKLAFSLAAIRNKND